MVEAVVVLMTIIRKDLRMVVEDTVIMVQVAEVVIVAAVTTVRVISVL
jgi:hypothetical protein